VSELDGMVAVVTGTAQGIGRAIAEGIGAAGATVHGVDRDDVDLTVSAAVEEFFAGVGDVDILVNVAGGVVGQTHVPIDEVTDEAWDAVVDANLRTTMNCTRAAASRYSGKVSPTRPAGSITPEIPSFVDRTIHRSFSAARMRTISKC